MVVKEPPEGEILGVATVLGGVTLFTVTVIPVEVVVLGTASLATAVRVWVAFEAPVVSQEMEYGLEVSSEPRLDPSSLNWTPTTPTLSEAVAETVVVDPLTVALLLGEVTETVGGVESEGGVETEKEMV